MFIFIPFFFFLFFNTLQAKIVRYELTATKNEMNLSGKKKVDFALMLNGQIPAPTLEFTEGDEAMITVKNRIPHEELSLHWHGILLPPEMDGVPYVTTPPILSGEDFTFHFKIRQHGTYWYHSHTNVQEQKGVYGAFIIHPKKETIHHEREIVAVISDWSDENASDILKNLRKDGDYYLYKKDTIRSWLGALRAGNLKGYLYNEWTKMGGMDVSDVGYDAFLINGKRDLDLLKNAKANERIRLRIINASASTYFTIALADVSMKVVAVDGVDIEPKSTAEVLSAMAETHDILITIPPSLKNYQLKITALDGSGSATGWIGGKGEKVFAPQKVPPNLYASHDHDHGHAHMHHHQAKALTVDEIKSLKKTNFPKTDSTKIRDFKLVLGGDMNRYVWHINGKAINEDRNILIDEGEVVRFTFVNQTMMNHPMHLHGHFFRVINKFGDYSPLKHTVDVPPNGTRVIEFKANEPGEWMLHCHNLYHLKNGMARVVKYMSYTPQKKMKEMQKHDPHLHDHWYFYGNTLLATNRIAGNIRFSQTLNEWDARLEAKKDSPQWEKEGDIFFRRWKNSYFNWILGTTFFEKKVSAATGFGYLLPMLVKSNFLIDHRGVFRVDLEKRFQWTSTLFTEAGLIWRYSLQNIIHHPWDYDLSLMYSSHWSYAFGLTFTSDTLGVGLQMQF